MNPIRRTHDFRGLFNRVYVLPTRADVQKDLFMSHRNSKKIESNREGVHERLVDVVQKHCRTRYRKPYQAHNVQAFEHLREAIEASNNAPLILDSCCGTGMSSYQLARQYSDHLVIGVDQSCHRLSKGRPEATPENCLMLQANCEDIWRMCREHDIHFTRHYILYPNPYPKSVHLKRRWHGHPVFPVLADLADRTILRSNWSTYLEEFCLAWTLLTSREHAVETLSVETPLTLFEKKYHDSAQVLYHLELM